jgi:hypothetical protein
MAHGQHGLSAVETNGLAEQQPRDHPDEQNQVTQIRKRGVLTQEGIEFRMKAGREATEWWFCVVPSISRLPTHPINQDLFSCNFFRLVSTSQVGEFAVGKGEGIGAGGRE